MKKILSKLIWLIKFVWEIPFKPTEMPQNPIKYKSDPITPQKKESRLESKYLWIINNGHGKLQKGKRSPRMENGDVFEEWYYNRIIANGVCLGLRKKGIDNILLVPETEIGSFLKGRTDRANSIEANKPRRYVSIHFNAAPTKGKRWATAKGIETWFFHGSAVSKKLAKVFQRHLITQTGMTDRGIKSKPHKQFYELKNTEMPAVLTENGFFNNREEVKELMKAETLQKIIDAHVSAILEIENLIQ